MATKKTSTVTPANKKSKSEKTPKTKSKASSKKNSRTTKPSSDVLFWVGIGASAGGLEALREFVSKIPGSAVRNENITYIVAQHLSPKHQSMLVQLISRETNMEVREVTDGEFPEANVMYITPPNSDVFVEKGALRLRPPMSEISPKPSVDLFFSSMASEIGDRAIGVILSGTGSDGAHGMRALRAAGGMTIVQLPETAKYDGMPNSAIDTRCVDLILRPSEIVLEISNVVRSPKHFKLLQEQETSRSTIDELLHLLKKRTDVDFKDYKPGTLYRRIDRRIVACGMRDLDGYLDYVQDNPEELDVLFKDIMISVTSFFRDTNAFAELKINLAKMLKDKDPDDPIRIWVPGCATGEEAYSLAILLAEHFGGIHNLSLKNNVQIFATDIDVEALSRARKGVYPAATLEKLDQELRSQYFRHRDFSFEIAKPLRDVIVFSRHNVLEDPPFLRLDLITCRNMLIYFNNKLQNHVLNLFHYALLHSGILFLGKSESLGSSTALFQAIDSKNKIYRRKLVPSSDSSATVRNTFGSVRKPEKMSVIGGANKTVHDLSDSIVQAIAPDSLLIDENMDIVRIYGDIHAFMQISPGGASTNLMSMARKEFRQELRALAFKTLRENVNATILPKKLDIQGKMHEVVITIRPLHLKHSTEKLLIISFEKITLKKLNKPTLGNFSESEVSPMIAEIEQELTATREHLQTVVEELETSNEELQSANEEMQSTNEEMQSSNEELETSSEELQSTNEELLTVNEELNIKTFELTSANEELNNITESIDYPLLVVDKSLRLKRFNQSAYNLFHLHDLSEGELITSVESNVELSDLRTLIGKVMKNGQALSRQIDTESVCYFEKIVPYRDLDGRIVGAVLTYLDNTIERRSVHDTEISKQRYDLAVEGSDSGIWDWNIETDAMFWSSKMCSLLHVTNDQKVINFKDLERLIHSDDRDNVRVILDAHLQRGFDFNVECRMLRKEHYIWVQIAGKAVWDDQQNPLHMAGSLNDITQRKEAVEQLTESNQSLDRFAYVCSHDLKEPVRMISSFLELFLDKYGETLDEEGQLYLGHVKKSSIRMQEMIRDILLYSQLEHSGSQYTLVDCASEIEKALENLALTINETDAIITVGDLPTIRGDQMQIFQIFQNLISNSLKFCRDKQPKIVISAKDLDDCWEFSIKDNGIGMKEEHAAKIFNVFQRLNPHDDYPGTGIGLSICERAVLKHGGRIWIKSKPNEGATFYFTIAKKTKKRNGF